MSQELIVQTPFVDAELAMNPEPRVACLLLLDTSGSMAGNPIRQLNEGMAAFKADLLTDSLAVKRAEVGIITFGPVKIETEFQTVDSFSLPIFKAGSDTPMGLAIETGLRMLNDRKTAYKQNGIKYYRPWIFLITDGAPTDEWQHAASLVHQGEAEKSFVFRAIGVDKADINVLSKITPREPLKLKGLMFREFFQWLSSSLGTVSHSNPGEEHMVTLQNPVAPGGWGTVA